MNHLESCEPFKLCSAIMLRSHFSNYVGSQSRAVGLSINPTDSPFHAERSEHTNRNFSASY